MSDLRVQRHSDTHSREGGSQSESSSPQRLCAIRELAKCTSTKAVPYESEKEKEKLSKCAEKRAV